MNITLEQARTLDAFAKGGTLQAAARQLRKAHSAVLYGLKQLEEQTGLELLDRSGYRTRLTPVGEEVLGHCRRLLTAERELYVACEVLASGWEPVLKMVFDVVVPLEPVLEGVRALEAAGARTRVELSVASLAGVEERFHATSAQLMVTVLPVRDAGLVIKGLPPLTGRLVARRGHPLVRGGGQPLTADQLAQHVLLTVQGSDGRLGLPTGRLEEQSAVHLPDFHAKKAAIVAGIGFGWMPDWLIRRELKSGLLRVLPLRQGSVHRFEPRLCSAGALGPAGRLLAAALKW